MTETISLKDKIIELRSKILIHSYMYWYKDNPLVSDALFDAWKKQLVEYQAEHKQLLEKT
jgi:NAD-dependent DNA ligase